MRNQQRHNGEIIQRLPEFPFVFIVTVSLNHDRRDAVRQGTEDETDRNSD